MHEASRTLREQMRLLERRVGALHEAEMSCCGVTMAQCHALVEIGRRPGQSLGELAEQLELDASTTSRTVNNLVTQGLARRSSIGTDRRCVSIELTAVGEALRQKIETDMDAYYQKIYQQLPPDKRQQVLESLQLLLEIIEGEKCC